MKFLLSIICFGLGLQVNGQLEMTDSSLFDFWVGTWELTWKDASGGTGKGFNQIERVLGDKIIQENFKATEGDFAGYEGKSWTTFDAANQVWKQTWVDSQGAYLDFIAAIEGENRIFQRSFQKGEKNITQRMVFRDIEDGSFTWDWQSSIDGGEWNTNWQIEYKRIGR
jgi:hypothetical protein